MSRPHHYVLEVRHVPPDVVLALMDAAIGVLYLVMPPLRTSHAAYDVARSIIPIRAWGVVFVVLSVGILVALTVNPRYVGWAVRTVGPAVFVMWALMFIVSALTHPDVSPAWVPVYGYLAYRHTFVPIRARRC